MSASLRLVAPLTLALAAVLASAPPATAAEEASTAQLISFVVESLATDEAVVIPSELRRRTGEIIGQATDLVPTARAYAVITLALMERGDLITPVGYAPPEQAEALERIAGAFARCHERRQCGQEIGFLRQQAVELKKKSPKLKHPLAVQLLSLLPQQGFAEFADALPSQDPGDRDMIEVAKRRQAALSVGR